ncbi:MAG: PRK06851 family protein [Firmicutes bacterium]|nr:PRK06851 family protein [Bacillota bacterium]
MTARIRHAFGNAHTAKGYASFIQQAVEDVERLFVIKGAPGTGKSTLMRKAALEMAERGYEVEMLHAAADSDTIIGIIVPQLRMAMVDGSWPHVVDPIYPGIVGEIVDLGAYWDRDKLVAHRTEIMGLNRRIEATFDAVYQMLQEARRIHDQWSQQDVEAVDFEQVDALCERLIGEIFEHKPRVRHFFASGLTAAGLQCYYDNLTQETHTRFILTGVPGTGKSTLLKRIGAEAEQRGFDVDYFHCGLDAEWLDMVIVPQLSVAVLDGSPPHSFCPYREGDVSIDLNLLAVDRTLLATREEHLRDLAERYDAALKRAVEKLQEAKQLREVLEKYYVGAMDFAAVEAERDHLVRAFLTAPQPQGGELARPG